MSQLLIEVCGLSRMIYYNLWAVTDRESSSNWFPLATCPNKYEVFCFTFKIKGGGGQRSPKTGMDIIFKKFTITKYGT